MRIRIERARERDGPRSYGYYAYADDYHLAVFIEIDKMMWNQYREAHDLAGRLFTAEIRKIERRKRGEFV